MIIYKTIVGSRLYGTNTINSDYDYAAATLPEENRKLFCVGCDWRDGKQKLENDLDVREHDLRYFMYLAARGQTGFLESIFAPIEMISAIDRCIGVIQCGKLCGKIEDIRKNILTGQMNLVGPAYGYATSEYASALGITTGKLGENRKEALEKFGYSPKNAHHCLRIIAQTLYCLSTGEFSPLVKDHQLYISCSSLKTKPANWLDFLRDLKVGNVKRDEFVEIYTGLMDVLSTYHVAIHKDPAKSMLPFPNSQARIETINELVAEVISSHVFYDVLEHVRNEEDYGR